MRRYGTPEALRAAIEDRLRNEGAGSGTDVARLRRRTVFERLLVRLERASPGTWVVKGGMALELRLGGRARTTRDLDLSVRANAVLDEVHTLLVDALIEDPDGDGFEFRLSAPTPIAADEAGRPGWTFLTDARLGGRTFERVKIQIVPRADEITGTVRVPLPGALSFAGIEVVEVEVVDPAQHFAEKLHAYTREYGDRPNSRVRDLPDLVLLIEDGLDPHGAHRAAAHVFEVRGTHPLPIALPDPPAGWGPRYAQLAGELDISARTVDDAMTVVRAFWAQALAAETGD